MPRYGRAAFRVEENVEGMGGVTHRFTKRAKTCANGGDFALHRVYIRCRSSVSSGAEPLSCTSMSSSGISGQILLPGRIDRAMCAYEITAKVGILRIAMRVDRADVCVHVNEEEFGSRSTYTVIGARNVDVTTNSKSIS